MRRIISVGHSMVLGDDDGGNDQPASSDEKRARG